MEPRDLLNSERVLASKAANFVIRQADYGLGPLPSEHLMKYIGFAGKEAIGGRLHLTNRRLIFRSHAFNRMTGQLSIFLPEVTALRNASSLLVKKLDVQTAGSTETFIVWGVPSLIQTIERARAASNHAAAETVWRDVAANPESLGDGLTFSPIIDRLARDGGEIAGEGLGAITDPLGLATVWHLCQLYRLLSSKN